MQPFAVRRVRVVIHESEGLHVPAQPVVLLVTDDHDLRIASARSLRNLGYDVEAATHAGHAVLACLHRTQIDVVVVELEMADTSGPALARRLRRHHPGLPAVYLARSGTPDREGVLVRPFTSEDLVGELEAALTSCPAS
jgi:CheY-like chemotaxis protein